MKNLFFCLVLVCLSGITFGQTPLLPCWQYKTILKIRNYDAQQYTDPQVLVTVNTAALIAAGKLDPSCNDLRFMDATENKLLFFWIESGINTTTTKIWVKVPTLNSSGITDIVMYYGGPSNASNKSNGDSTFVFFDDFLGTQLDAVKWNDYHDNTVTETIDSSRIKFTGYGLALLTSKDIGITAPFILHTRVSAHSDYSWDLYSGGYARNDGTLTNPIFYAGFAIRNSPNFSDWGSPVGIASSTGMTSTLCSDYDEFVTRIAANGNCTVKAPTENVSVSGGDASNANRVGIGFYYNPWNAGSTCAQGRQYKYVFVRYHIATDAYHESTGVETSIFSFGNNVNAGRDTSICFGDSVQLNGTGTGTLLWRPSASLSDSTIGNPFAKPVTTTLYILRATTPGCISLDTVIVTINGGTVNAGRDTSVCPGDSVQLSGMASGTARWFSSSGLSDSTVLNPYAKSLTTASYILQSGSGSCISRDTIVVTVNNISVNAGKDTSFCNGDSVQLQATASGIFTWSPSTGLSNTGILNPYAKPAVSRAYILTTYDNGCSLKDTITVTVNGVTVDAGRDTSICPGDSVQLMATGASTYLWSSVNTLSSLTIPTPFARPADTTTYIVKGGQSGCFVYDSVRVNVVPIVVDAGSPQTVCIGQKVQLQGNTSHPYIWSPAGSLSSTVVLNPYASPRVTTRYYLTANNSVCQRSDSVLISVDSVVSSFTVNQQEGMAPLPVQFANQSINGAHYLWLFDSSNNATSTDVNPQYTFKNGGTYQVKLITINANGCSDTSEVSIDVLENKKVFIPNVFTPNGDGLNELFIVECDPSLTAHINGSIWNRWGGQIYSFVMPDGKWWDGKVGGTPASDGVYFYIIEVTTIFGKTTTYRGTITLLR